MRIYISLIALLAVQYSWAQQQKNIFLGREYWNAQPTIEQIKEDIKQGNSPTAFSPFRFDATCYAILQNAPLKTIDFLTDMTGNEATKITHDGRNYLLWAAYKGNVEAMKMLVKKGSDVKLVDEHGYNLLTFAAFGSHFSEPVFRYIQSLGIDIKSTDRQGANALLIAASNAKGIDDLEFLLKEGFPLDSQDKGGNNVFFYGASSGNIQLLKELIDYKVDAKKENALGENALFSAARGKRRAPNTAEVFKFLLEIGLEPTIINKNGETILHRLAGNNPDIEIYKMFIEQGVKVDAVDHQGNSAFLVAAKRHNTPIAKELSKMYKSQKEVNKLGQSALTFAVMNYDQDLFDFMLGNNADLQIKDADGKNLLNYLFENYNDRDATFFEKNIEKLREQIKPEADKKEGNTPLHIAVKKNDIKLVDSAMHLGLDINQLNKEGLSPLHLAAMKAKNLKIIEYLLEQGADKYQKTEFGEIPFDLAKENEFLKGEKIEILK